MARKKENKRQDGYYEVKCVVDHTFDGKAVYKSFYSKKSKADARLKAEEYKQKILTQNDKSLKRFKDAAEELLEIKRQQVRGVTYICSYVCSVEKKLIPFFGEFYVEEITIDHINSYFKKYSSQKFNSLKHDLTLLKTVFNYCVEQGYVKESVCRGYKLNYGAKSEEKRVYTQEQAELVLNYCHEHRYGLGVHLMLSYGMSRSETLGIDISSVDFESKTINIIQSVTAGHESTEINKTKNRYRKREVAVSDETLELIKETGIEKGWLFPSQNRKNQPITPNAFSRDVKVFMQDMHEHYLKEGKDIPELNPHELRHSRASIWVNDGKNLFAIALQMGWADLEMLRKRYGHADIASLRKELGL